MLVSRVRKSSVWALPEKNLDCPKNLRGFGCRVWGMAHREATGNGSRIIQGDHGQKPQHICPMIPWILDKLNIAYP